MSVYSAEARPFIDATYNLIKKQLQGEPLLHIT